MSIVDKKEVIIENSTLKDFIHLVSENIGHEIQQHDIEKFHTIILSRMESLKLLEAGQYYNLLKDKNSESHHEWEKIITQFTIGESYFFRDKGQFALLKNLILPRLIERKREEKSLRIWSAGCSAGEEIYSVAILINELLPYKDGWNIFILGTDINKEAIARGNQGVYNKRSLREIDSEIMKKYFHYDEGGWKLDMKIRKMVSLKYHNLIKDDFLCKLSELKNMDLILCRHVLIYFDAKAISIVVEKLIDNLSAGGYLFSGHTELSGQKLDKLKSIIFPESVIYQRAIEQESHVMHSNSGTKRDKIYNSSASPVKIRPKKWHKRKEKKIISPANNIPKQETEDLQSRINELEALFKKCEYAEVVNRIESIIKYNHNNFMINYLLARSYANLGNYERAMHFCDQTIRSNVFSIKPYFLKAHIVEEQGDNEEAKNLLKKVIYLDPSFIPAYLELGSIYEGECDHGKAGRLRTTALELLQALPPDAHVEPYDELTVAELILYIQKMDAGKNDTELHMTGEA